MQSALSKKKLDFFSINAGSFQQNILMAASEIHTVKYRRKVGSRRGSRRRHNHINALLSVALKLFVFVQLYSLRTKEVQTLKLALIAK